MKRAYNGRSKSMKYSYGVELLKKQTDPRVISAMHVILHKLGEDYTAGRITNKLV